MGKQNYKITYGLKGFLTDRKFVVKAKSEAEALEKCKTMLGGAAKRCTIKGVEIIEK